MALGPVVVKRAAQMRRGTISRWRIVDFRRALTPPLLPVPRRGPHRGGTRTTWPVLTLRSSGSSVRQRSNTKGQRVWKRQPEGGLIGLGTSPRRMMRLRVDRRVRHRHRREQRARIGMVRRREQRAPVGELDDLAEIHHRDAMRQVLDDRKVMADEQQREAEFVLQVGQQVDDLRLDGNVERGNRLVADDQVRPGASARAMPMRCRWPPENSCGIAAASRRAAAAPCPSVRRRGRRVPNWPWRGRN